jgi:ketosteroid isomerase-like protein
VTVNPRLAAGYESLSRGDLDTWLGGLHEDAELHELAEIPDTAVYRGHREIRTWAEEGMSLVADWEWVPEDVLHQGEGLVVLRVRFSGRGVESGAPLEQILFHVIEVRDEKAAVIRGFLSEREAMVAAGIPG